MITNKNSVFHIATKDISYLIALRGGQYLENLYIGRKLPEEDDVSCLTEKFGCAYGNSVTANDNVTLDNLCLEYSSEGTGDFRISPMHLVFPDQTCSDRFVYQSFRIYEGIYEQSDKTMMPHARQKQGERTDTLEIVLVDKTRELILTLVYTSFYDSNVITRRMILKNNEKQSVFIQKMMSMMLDLPETNYSLHTFDGLWARERLHNKKTLVSGIYVNESHNGTSSNRHNPLIILQKEGGNEDYGECIACNLIYSGNHSETVEVSEYGKLRILTGMHEYHMNWELTPEQLFYSPEAVLTFSSQGLNGVSALFHDFIKNHIMPPDLAFQNRPILINNWEATYFDFNQSKLMSIAKEAAKLGIELFVLDDGWFGKRENDTTSLGDWYVNEKKLGCSIKEFSEKIKKLGMQFGLWLEPEMISRDSDLYRNHPEWAVEIPGVKAYLGRNQLVLDFTNKEVRDYIVTAIAALLQSADISYVKWDMNRPLTDAYSIQSRSGEFYHRYVLGLYEVLERLRSAFPHILMEGCSAGGNRFDLGMLYYMPQIWTSDDTDADERMKIQEGTSYGYPISAMGAHVSAAPNHQTLRNINIETRFQVACVGMLGYELNLASLSPAEKKIVKQQIVFYKKYRSLFLNGDFYRGRLANNSVLWQMVSKDKKEALALIYSAHAVPNKSDDILKLKGLHAQKKYRIYARESAVSVKEFGNLINQATPIKVKEDGLLVSAVDKVYRLKSEKEEYIVSGAMLMYGGIKLKQRFIGTGYNENTRVMNDYSSRLYVIEEVQEDKIDKEKGEMDNEQ